MSISIFVQSLTFNDGTTLNFSQNDIVVFVGPNNAGKSASLREMYAKIRHNAHPGVVLRDLTLSKSGDVPELVEMLTQNHTRDSTNGADIYFKGYGFNINHSHIGHYWQTHNQLGELIGAFVSHLKTEDRLQASNAPKNISLTTDSPQHPIHIIQRDDEIENRFSGYFRQAFGQDLIVHRNAGNVVPLHIGEKPALGPGEDRVSVNYLRRLEQLPKLQEQGDGMRSFVGVLLHAFISTYNILLLDEPEAFLHPPQARLLGKMLAKELPSGKQIFMSTHSEHLLKGLLDSGRENLKIVRLQREANINHISVLNSEDINSIWNDSLLRHSNVLDGLFHSKVIICESDSDCRFYSAVLDSLYEGTDNVSPDVLFIHCGGKHRIPVVVKALRRLNVPISVVTDFDVLNDTNPLRPIIEELGGAWPEIEKDWKIVKQSIDAKRPEFLTVDLKEEIEAVLSEIGERIFPSSSTSKIQRLLKKASAWAQAKEMGKGFIPGGDATQAYNRLSATLESLGFYVVEVGELECFVKSIGNHGPTWVNDVLHKDLKYDPELEQARYFVKKII